jgi:hypothetical protein
MDCLINGIGTIKTLVMKRYRTRLVIFLAFTIGTLIGVFKGEEAKQKWVFKIKSKYDTKRQVAERKMIARKGGVLLDEIEMASYHNN